MGLEEDTPHLPVASGREHRNVLWLAGAETSWHLLTASHFLSQPAARPPVPAHQVPPYKAVSARLRPFTFSQSTPIGLDRVGRRRQMKTSNGESWSFLESFVWDQGARGTRAFCTFSHLAARAVRQLLSGLLWISNSFQVSTYTELLQNHASVNRQLG